jgi:hypothetical protein
MIKLNWSVAGLPSGSANRFTNGRICETSVANQQREVHTGKPQKGRPARGVQHRWGSMSQNGQHTCWIVHADPCAPFTLHSEGTAQLAA